MYLKLAWRNIWRNKRRTGITLASIFFAVILSSLMMSIKEGTYVNMIDSMVADYTGYVQVHSAGYWDDKTLDKSFILDENVKTAIGKEKGIDTYLKRLESFALAAGAEKTRGTMVVGIEPKDEQEISELHKRVVRGEYFNVEDKSALVGNGLAKHLKIDVGDTIVLLGQGYHGANAAGKYHIKGVVKFGSPELSNKLVFLPIKEAQWLYAMEGRYTNLVLMLDDKDKADKIAGSLNEKLGDGFEVMSWTQLLPELVNMIETDRVEGYVFMAILYMVLIFGIFGTMLMMLAERHHEFGVMISVGMGKLKLGMVVWSEVIMISLMGAVIGILGAFPICYYLNVNPITFGEDMSKMYEEYGMEAILRASVEPELFFQQAAIVAFMAVIIGLFPFYKLMMLKPIEALSN